MLYSAGARPRLSQRPIYRLELSVVDVKRSTMLAFETVFRDAGIAFEDSANGSVKITVTARALKRYFGSARQCLVSKMGVALCHQAR